ncbi:MAG: aminotransferase class III-fold pyridoxal phosphate-dependent enzyme [Gaiellales bacterium]
MSSLSVRARRVIPGGANSGARIIGGLDELVITSAQGATVTDEHGRTYVDYHVAYGPVILGHADEDVLAAVTQACRRVDIVGVGVTPVEVELAEKITSLVPCAEQVVLLGTGTEATFYAVRLARGVTGRRLLVKFQGCFHGSHDAVAMNVISAPDRVGVKDPLSIGILPEVVDATLVLPFNDLEAVRAAVAEHGDDIAAIILEPIPHNVGAILPEQEFLVGLREICDRRGIVLIFDEVITGFRHGLGGYQAVCGVTPDVTALGKAMANGYPIAALAGRRDLLEQFSTVPGGPVMLAGTYNGHPGMVAAALETIRKLEEEPVHEHLFRLGDLARRGLQEMFDEHGVAARVTGFGSVWVSYFLEGPVTTYTDLLRNDAELYVGYRRRLLEHGILELPVNLKRNHFTYAHREHHVEQLIEATAAAVTAELEARALLGGRG